MRLNTAHRLLAALGLVMLAAIPTFAADSSDIAIHGFGGWAYGKTDGLTTSIGTQKGNYDNAEFALNISAKPYENLSLVAQTRLTSESGSHTDLDYAFAEWKFNDALKLRVGRVKHPFGIYGEVFDVGTLRPFYLLPQSLYGPNGFTARAYNGAGLTGNIRMPKKWGLQYDVYGGQIQGDFETPGLIAGDPALFSQPSIKFQYKVNDTIGGRLSINTPINGLSFGGSGYRGKATTDISVLSGVATRTVNDIHVDYSGDRFTLRAEKGHLRNGTDFSVNSDYVEAAYKLTEHWQIAARTEKLKVGVNLNLSQLPPIYPQLLKNSENAVSLSYWFRPNFVLRGSVQQIKGNRFAFPATSDEVMQALATNHLKDTTRLLVFGAQFSF
jgi:hypothetical protein